MDFAFPPELSDAVRRLYHLRRGPLVSPGPLQSMDDRAEKRSLFLRLPLDACLCMMAPSLWTSGSIHAGLATNLSETAPPETLVLWENVSWFRSLLYGVGRYYCSLVVRLTLPFLSQCIIAADHYMNMFVWSGRATQGETDEGSRQRFRQLLEQRAQHRFPMPKLHLLSEGDSMSRRFTSLLAPSHGDPPDHQMAHFPALEHLSQDELTQLRAKFRFHDPAVDPSFRQWFWEVASAARISKGNGISLCE
jgi:hypothetical protein